MSGCFALECYVCEQQEGNDDECIKTVRMCQRYEDTCAQGGNSWIFDCPDCFDWQLIGNDWQWFIWFQSALPPWLAVVSV
jgi:hypothetical protein